MKTFFITFVTFLAVAVIGAYYTFYLNRSVPDVRYTLSDRVPVSFLGTNEKLAESVQQLEVKNIGTAEAKRIRIKINGEVTTYKVDKFSEGDTPQIFNQNQSFELVYPELPPQAPFKLLFKSSGDGIQYSDLSINHSGGPAQQAFTKKEVSWTDSFTSIGFIIYVPIVCIYFVLTAISFRDSMNKYHEVDKLLKANKPWYIRDKKWHKMQIEALSYRIEKYYFYGHKINTSEPYLLLSADKPEFLDDTDWNTIVNKACGTLQRGYSAAIYSFSTDLLELLKVEKPKLFPENDWHKLKEEAANHYFHLKLRFLHGAENVLRALRETKPEVIQENYWVNYREDLQKRYREEIQTKLKLAESPMEILQDPDLIALKPEDREHLRDLAYRLQKDKLPDITNSEQAKIFLESERPAWLNDIDYRLLRLRAENIRRLEQEAERLHEERKSIQAQSKANAIEQERLTADKKNIATLKEKIERQLNIIHSLLSDPSTLDRIEDYDDTFAPGNFENLKQIATILKVRST